LSNGLVIIDVDTPTINKHDKDYQKVVELCTKGKYGLAKPILSRLIKENPSVSEYHRILGQIYSDEGDQDLAIDKLMDALRWNPDNAYALLMTGNVFAKFKNDVKTATKYYDLALAADPNNNITLNNIGANLLQLGKLEEGKRYLEIAYDINQNYPNTLYGLGLYYSMIESFEESFDWLVKGLKACDNNNPIKKHLHDQIFTVAKSYLSSFNSSTLVYSFVGELESRSTKKIKLVIDNSIPTAAKIEFAENHNAEDHIVRYKSKYPSYNHLIMHELVHLKLVLEAREYSDGANKLFIITQEHRKKFISDHESALKKLERKGYSDNSISNYIESLFNGINQQVFMAPIDLFIEEYLYSNYPKLRPLQLISLQTLLLEGIQAVTAKEKTLIPPAILSASTILNIVSALHFQHLFGLDYLPLFGDTLTPNNKRIAEKFFNEFIN
jgi:tetratricopeptide (TPR) repeat protein